MVTSNGSGTPQRREQNRTDEILQRIMTKNFLKLMTLITNQNHRKHLAKQIQTPTSYIHKSRVII